jgi:ribonuclease J
LITEGTRIADEAKEESEELVYKGSSEIVSKTENLVFADFNFKDVDRLRTFFKIAKKNDRKFVVKINDAYFLKYLSQDKHLDVPNIDDENIIIYLPKRGSGAYQDSDYKGNDKEFLDLHNTWTAEQIAARPNKVLCAIGFYSFTALIDMKPKSGALYIHSASEPYNEDQELSQDRINAWLDHFSMNKFQSHCSGHARGSDLLEAVSQIETKTIFPIHTEHPEKFRKISDKIHDVKEGQKYIIS